MAARKKSTRKTGATAASKQKSTAASETTRAAKARSTSKRSKSAVKPKAKPSASKAAASKPAGKRFAASRISAKSRAGSGKTGSTRATARVRTKKTARAGGKTTTKASPPNSKRVEAKLQTKIDQKSKTKAATQGATPIREEKNKVTPTRSVSETPAAKAPAAAVKEQKIAAQPAAPKATKSGAQRQGFKLNEFVVYPAHGVGQIVAIEEQEVAGFKLELFVISFSKDKMTLRVPTSKGAGVGMRKISDPDTAKRSLEILSGRARIRRTMWSRRAQEYEAKINSGDINAIAEVVRDLYRSDAQPEQSYSERQLYEAALDRMVREIAAVQKTSEIDALRAVEAQLQRSHGRSKAAAAAAAGASLDPEIEEAA